MNVIEIVKAHLETNGYGGLVHSATECGCCLDDLVPCGSLDSGECRAGYVHRDPRDATRWLVSTKAEAPSLETFDGLD